MDPRPPTPPGPCPSGPGAAAARARSAAADPDAGSRARCRRTRRPRSSDLKPVSETPTEPSDYAAISLVFGSLLAGLAASARSREPIPRADLVPLSAATFSLSRLIVHDKAESWLREPFVAEEATGGGRRAGGCATRSAS